MRLFCSRVNFMELTLLRQDLCHLAFLASSDYELAHVQHRRESEWFEDSYSTVVKPRSHRPTDNNAVKITVKICFSSMLSHCLKNSATSINALPRSGTLGIDSGVEILVQTSHCLYYAWTSCSAPL